MNNTQAVPVAPAVAGYAKASGIIALVLAIVGVVIPVVGVLFITPLAIIFGIVALHGGDRGIGIAVIIVVAVNLIISPTFWLNIGAAATIPGATANRVLAYIDVIGVAVMIYFAARIRAVAER
jgi:hypothetical protein